MRRLSRAAGYEKITQWTQSNLLAARHLYEAAGFTCVRDVNQTHTFSFVKRRAAEELLTSLLSR